MNKLYISSFALCMAGSVHAGIPLLNATCPGGIAVHADAGGPVYINGKTAKLTKFNDSSYDAVGSGITVSIAINPDGSAIVVYTGQHGVNGVCQLADHPAGSDSKKASAKSPAAAAGGNAGNDPLVVPGNMAAYCRGEASSQFATRPAYIKTGKLTRSTAGYVVKGTADLGNEGNKPFQCEFSAQGEFLHFKSLVNEGRL